MPEQPQESFIKDLPEILRVNDLYPTHFEVENGAGATPVNSKVGFGTVVNAVAQALPGANRTKSLYKSVRLYSRDVPGGNSSDETLLDLDPEFLALGAICYVEFPQPSREYRLVYAQNGPLSVWIDGAFANMKVRAQWVERNSLEEKASAIPDFLPFTTKYGEDETVKYYLNGVLRLFSAKQELVKADFPDNLIPAPTGLDTDAYWAEINASGGSSSPAYDDTALKGRVTQLEADAADLLDNIETAKTDLNARIDALVTAALPWAGGAYAQGQFVTNGGNVYLAKQDIANSTIAPTSTNVYWLQVNGSGSGSGASYDDTELRSLLNGKVDKVAGKGLSTNDYTNAEKAKLAGLQNYTLQADSVDEAKLSPAVRAKLNETGSGTVDTINDEQVLVSITGITENVGGVKAGSSYEGTLEGLVLKMLKTYQQPAFTYFAYNGEGSRTVEAGTTFSGADAFAWGTSNPANVKPGSITLKSNGAVLGSGLANDGSESFDLASFTLEVGQSRSFEISAVNTQEEAFAAGLTLSTALARYYGASSLTPAQFKTALAGQSAASLGLNKDLGTRRSLNYNYNCDGGKWVYILLADGLGAPSTVQQGPNNFSAYTLEAVTIQDVFGISRSYRLLYTGYQTAPSFNLNIVN